MQALPDRTSEPRAPVPASVARYRLVAELGRGGMANVFLAVSDAMGGAFSKLVVVKQLREHVATDAEFVTMFLDEARLAARLNHPNVVQTLDSGVDGTDLFIAMEYLDGQSFQRLLSRARGDALPLPMRLAIVSDVLAGLHYAHELRDFDGSDLHVVHRDVTPHNVFVTYDGQVKVLDFGIARAEGRASQTRHGVIKGKLAYMAPEQARGAVLDRRADIFGVGVMLYEAITGTRLWGDLPDKSIYRALLVGDQPPPPLVRNPRVPAALDGITRRALAFRREDRFPNALVMQQELDEVLEATWGRPSARRLGAEVAQLFEDRRALTRRVIEQQLAHLSSESRVRVVSLASSMPITGDDADAPSAVHEEATARLDSKDTRIGAPDADLLVEAGGDSQKVPTSKLGHRARTAARAALIVLAVVATAGAGAIVGANFRSLTAAPATVKVSLRASPEHARFRVDDGPELENPFVGEMPRDDHEHTLVITAAGYPRREQPLRLTDDVSLRLVLVR